MLLFQSINAEAFSLIFVVDDYKLFELTQIQSIHSFFVAIFNIQLNN